MASLNSVTLTGNLTRDIELKTTASGTNVANVTIAVNGFKEGDTSFIDLVLFGKTAEVASKYLSKGQAIGITGRLKQESWEDKTTEQKRSKIVVVVDNLQLPPKGSQSGSGGDIAPDNTEEPINLERIPF